MEPTESGVNCTGTCTMVITLKWPEITEEEVTDYATLWGLFLAVGVTVICLKALYNRFRIDHD